MVKTKPLRLSRRMRSSFRFPFVVRKLQLNYLEYPSFLNNIDEHLDTFGIHLGSFWIIWDTFGIHLGHDSF